MPRIRDAVGCGTADGASVRCTRPDFTDGDGAGRTRVARADDEAAGLDPAGSASADPEAAEPGAAGLEPTDGAGAIAMSTGLSESEVA